MNDFFLGYIIGVVIMAVAFILGFWIGAKS